MSTQIKEKIIAIKCLRCKVIVAYCFCTQELAEHHLNNHFKSFCIMHEPEKVHGRSPTMKENNYLHGSTSPTGLLIYNFL